MKKIEIDRVTKLVGATAVDDLHYNVDDIDTCKFYEINGTVLIQEDGYDLIAWDAKRKVWTVAI